MESILSEVSSTNIVKGRMANRRSSFRNRGSMKYKKNPLKKPRQRNNQLLRLKKKSKLSNLKSPRRKNLSQSRNHRLRSLLKMMKMFQLK